MRYTYQRFIADAGSLTPRRRNGFDASPIDDQTASFTSVDKKGRIFYINIVFKGKSNQN